MNHFDIAELQAFVAGSGSGWLCALMIACGAFVRITRWAATAVPLIVAERQMSKRDAQQEATKQLEIIERHQTERLRITTGLRTTAPRASPAPGPRGRSELPDEGGGGTSPAKSRCRPVSRSRLAKSPC